MKTVISTSQAPAAIGPYAQAVKANGLVITSGQLPIDPAAGTFPEGIQAQTRQSLTNVKAILEEAGLTMDAVLKTTVFLSDMNNFAAMNEVYAASPPAPLWRSPACPRTRWWRSRSSPPCNPLCPRLLSG